MSECFSVSGAFREMLTRSTRIPRVMRMMILRYALVVPMMLMMEMKITSIVVTRVVLNHEDGLCRRGPVWMAPAQFPNSVFR